MKIKGKTFGSFNKTLYICNIKQRHGVFHEYLNHKIMKPIKMIFKLQMSDIDGIYTRTITSPVRLNQNSCEYKMTFVELSEHKARKLNVGNSMYSQSLRDYKDSKCIITRIK